MSSCGFHKSCAHYMFTGIIEEIGKVKRIKREGYFVKLTLVAYKVLENTNVGDSIAVNGVCLTVVGISKDELEFDIMKETLDTTTFFSLKINEYVNLERAVRADTRLSGHIVSGHVDGVGKIKNISLKSNPFIIIETPRSLHSYLIPKGSIAIDGISLTIANFKNGILKIFLIPQTIKNTTLPFKNTGSSVNLELDINAKVATQKALNRLSNIDMGFLKEHGFLS